MAQVGGERPARSYADGVGAFLVILLSALVLFVLLGGAIVWLVFAWARQMWREVRRTPTFGQVSRGMAMARPVLAYRDVLRRAPALATELTVRIQRKAIALEAIGAQLGAEPRFRVGETTKRYLPDTMEAYRVAAVGQGTEQREEASRLLVEQLTQIDRNLDRIASGAGEAGISALRANGIFLDQISSSSELKAIPSSTEEDKHPSSGTGTGEHKPA